MATIAGLFDSTDVKSVAKLFGLTRDIKTLASQISLCVGGLLSKREGYPSLFFSSPWSQAAERIYKNSPLSYFYSPKRKQKFFQFFSQNPLTNGSTYGIILL
jgi:hypothetical protein